MLVIFFIVLLTGCTAAGDRLSGSALHRDPAITYPTSLDSIHIGGTTKDEVRSLFGNPTDIQLAPNHTQARESWAYARANPSTHPLQYVPGFGVFALSKHSRQSSFSVSFSSDGIVDGIGLRDVQPLGVAGASMSTIGTTYPVLSYGMNNPLTHHARQDTSVGSENFRE